LDWDLLSHKIITDDFINKFPNKPWNWHALTSNQNITIQFIEKFSDKKWYLSVLAKKKGLTIGLIKKIYQKCVYSGYRDYLWDFDKLTQTINIKEILQYPYFDWNWSWIVYNYPEYITDCFLIKNINYLWPIWDVFKDHSKIVVVKNHFDITKYRLYYLNNYFVTFLVPKTNDNYGKNDMLKLYSWSRLMKS